MLVVARERVATMISMSAAPPQAAQRVRLNAWDRAFALWDPEVPPLEPRWHLVAEALAALDGRAAVALCGHAPRGVVVEVEQAPVDRPPPEGALRLGVRASRGLLWLGDPAAPGDGALLAAPAGELAVEVQRIEAGRYRMRLAPVAQRVAAPAALPLLDQPVPRADRYLVRPRALEEQLAAAERAHDPAQERLMRRLGPHDRFELDLDRSELVLERDGRPTARAIVHPLGTEGDLGGFRWAWANPTIEAPQAERARRLLAHGVSRGLVWLTDGELELPPLDVRRLACLAAPLVGCAGFYPAPYARGILWLAVE
jgi:hypothetical protein